jgi:PAS domain S-box-containing protein
VRTAVALYGVGVVGAALGLLPLWGVAALGGSLGPAATAGPSAAVLTRGALPVLGTLLGMALWPALRRRLFSVANQLRYGLPLFILATFLFAGRLFVDRTYRVSRAETAERLRAQSRALARAVDATLDRAQRRLRTRSPAGPGGASDPLFRWVEQGAGPEAIARPAARRLAARARRTGRPARGFIPLPDTSGHSLGVAVPVAADTAAGAPGRVAVAGLRPAVLQRTFRVWGPETTHLYLVTRDRVPVVERAGAPASTADPAPLVRALLDASGATAEAAQGRYGPDVLGAIAPLPGLAGHVVVEQARQDASVHVFETLVTMILIALLACGGALAVGFYVSRRVVAPLDRLIEAARRVGAGTLDVQVPVEQDNELGELARTFNAMTQDLSTSVERLQANEERLRMALDAAQMGTWNWTADADEAAWSPQTYALLGVPPARTERLYAAFLARVHPDDRAQVADRIEAVRDGQTRFTIEHRIRPRPDEVRWVRVQGRVVRTEGTPRRMSGVIMDITSQKEAEEELMAAKEEAEEMSRLKSAFLANVSHEIRTPLTSIIGFAEILAEEVPAAHEGEAEKIVRSGRRLMRTLDSVLDLSMIEAGEFSLDCRPFDLAAEVRQRTDLLRPTAERKGLDVTVDVPDPGIEVHLDPNCLDRILTNLLTNAIKFTESGEVAVAARPTEEGVVVEVQDTGIGIGADFRPQLFEAFKQESGGLQREHEGTGLGLSITKELVDLMEGTIAVESQKGEGTRFTVCFPYHLPRGANMGGSDGEVPAAAARS